MDLFIITLVAISNLACVLTGAWITHRAYQHKSPVPQVSIPFVDDMPEPFVAPDQEVRRK